ncbi:hypothetical protein IWW48_003474 [Coemansia sp. RSA 1200]|nr:hypothetical protein IWW48_003474 [Coemansia sp. RSA 1200]
MSTTLTIAYAQGKSVKVTVAPMTTLQSVIAEACAKIPNAAHPESYQLIHNKKTLDLSLPVRFVNLPQGATLTLKWVSSPSAAAASTVSAQPGGNGTGHQVEQVPNPKPKPKQKQAVIKVALQIVGGSRIINDFEPTATLWDIVSTAERGGGALNLTSRYCEYSALARKSETPSSPLENVQRKVFGSVQNLYNSISRGGSADSSRSSTPSVSSTRSPSVPPSAASLVYQQPVLQLPGREVASFEEMQATTLRSLGFTSGQALVRLSFRDAPTPTALPPVSGLAPENQKPQTHSPTPRLKEPSNEPAKESSSDSKQTASQPAEKRSPAPVRHTEQPAPKEAAGLVAQRQIRVYANHPGSPSPAAVKIELPDSFYNLSSSDASMLISAQRSRLQEADRGFRMRSAEEKKRLEQQEKFKHEHPTTVIRFRFPDTAHVQATFASTERISELFAFVQSILVSPNGLATLTIQPPAQDLDIIRGSSLFDAKLAPAAVVHVQLRSDVTSPSFSALGLLRPEIAVLARPLAESDAGTTALHTGDADATDPATKDHQLPSASSPSARSNSTSTNKTTSGTAMTEATEDTAGHTTAHIDTVGSDNVAAETEAVKMTPLPWEKLLVLLSVRLAEPINYSLILPFVYKMVLDFGVAKSTKDVAFYATLLFTSFSSCQALTIMYWGRLSDRIGRRPVLLIGLAGNLVSYMTFGLAKSFWVALAARLFNGLLAGNVAVVKSVISEISDDSNRASMMAYLSLMGNVGMVLGAAIGGIFADPAHQYPAVFGNIQLFVTFPYLLPCAIGCSVTVFGLLMGTFKFQETLVRNKPRAVPPTANSSSQTLAIETAPLLAIEDQEAQTTHQPAQHSVKGLLTPTVLRVMTTNFFMCLSMSMGDQIYPIFAASSTSDGGLGFESRYIGFSLAISGLSIFYVQLFVYPRLERKYGALFCYHRGQMMLLVPFLCLSLLSLLAAHLERLANGANIPLLPRSWSCSVELLEHAGLWVLLIALLLIQIVAKVMVLTSINLITANLAPSRNELGFMNGAQQLAMTLTRIIGPLLTGTIWTWSIKHAWPFPFDSHFVWTVATLFTLTSYFISLKIPKTVNTFAAGKDDDGGEE